MIQYIAIGGGFYKEEGLDPESGRCLPPARARPPR